MKTYQVADHYFCTKYILGFTKLHLSRVCSGGKEVTVGYRKARRLHYNNVTPNILFSTYSFIQNMQYVQWNKLWLWYASDY